LNITNQIPNYPDAGIAKAAKILVGLNWYIDRFCSFDDSSIGALCLGSKSSGLKQSEIKLQ
jgi:hypothetical protein